MRLSYRFIKDKLIENIFLLISAFAVLTILFIGIGLYSKSYPILSSSPLSELLFTSKWKPASHAFGFYAYIIGSITVTLIAVILSLPLSLLTAIFLTEYASEKLRKSILPLIDLLAGIPPVIYGVWGVLVIVPFIQSYLASRFVDYSTGYSALAGGIVLAIMIFPLMINIFMEVFKTIPVELREASLSLGANKWETIKFVLLKKSLPGIIAATVLAISRALGETIAVLMVCGNIAQIPHSVFDSVYPLPALIANNYGDMLSIPLYDSALMFGAFILFVIILVFNVISRLILYRIEKRM